ncbi:hypothetical protein ACFX1R_002528 [Malus domestica]
MIAWLISRVGLSLLCVRSGQLRFLINLELLKQQHDEEEMLQIALACVTKLPETRPNMDEVVRMIEELRHSDRKTRQSSESKFDVQTP